MTPGERYTIRTEAKQANPSNIIISRLYIDGKYNGIHYLHQQKSPRSISYFVNYERNKAYYLKFASTSQFDKKDDGVFKVPFPVNKHPNKQNQFLYGKPGTITAGFFKGIIVDESALLNKPDFEVKQVRTPDNREIGYTTGYDVMDATIQPSTVTKIVDWKPMAVLHLNYRSADWLAKIFPLSSSTQKEMEFSNNNVDMEQPTKIMKIDKTYVEKKKKYNIVYGIPTSCQKIITEKFEKIKKIVEENAEKSIANKDNVSQQKNNLKRNHNKMNNHEKESM
ncbi:11611_t:CDS:1 [Funneliformis mosseae]|uniref:11611_t:CDS:1 n=1 Tax=Funneliformis mosseae TaxID=27381 RepID=A0A9N9BKR1_FUNMO|nr:11611_t:CDS:1 [Funneliformis mosseae]